MTSCCLRFIHPAMVTRKNCHGVQVMRRGIVAASGERRKGILVPGPWNQIKFGSASRLHIDKIQFSDMIAPYLALLLDQR